MSTPVFYCPDIKDLISTLDELLLSYPCEQRFVLCDENTQKYCLERIRACPCLKQAHFLCIPSGEEHKNMDTLCQVWTALSDLGATRKAVLIHLGGGLVCDLGGFAAATFKRGIDFIHIPTSLLSCVDAAIGGKTGIDFNGLKNEVGVFAPAKAILIHTPFLETLDRKNRLSGYGEMLKHGLLSNPAHWKEVLHFDPTNFQTPAFDAMLRQSIRIKEEIVQKDPFEKGLRKALNLGHTIGHAFEMLSQKQQRPILHGHAVAAALICELYLSYRKWNFPSRILQAYLYRVRELFPFFPIECKDYDLLLDIMQHDKKNSDKKPCFALLSDIGLVQTDASVDKTLIEESFDFYRDSTGC